MARPLTITLDTNCIVDIDENRKDAPFVRKLVEAHAAGAAVVHVIAIMASEKQKGGGHLASFEEFTERLRRLGLGHLPQLLPLMYFDVSYWDHCLCPSEEDARLDGAIHEILFPDVPDRYLEGGTDEQLARWRNAKCDVQALWSHIHAGNDVFVSGDRNFHKASKLPRLLALGAERILKPKDAAALVGQA